MLFPVHRGLRAVVPGLGLVLAGAAALLPWMRNHDHLKDFYDYGLVVAGNARILAGEAPYADFTTPIQTATFLLNLGAEQAGGGTFVGMTWGAAAFIAVSLAGLFLLLGRHWPSAAALAVATAITCASAAQHTIIWHNTVGVFALALVAWGSAVAPRWERRAIGWNLVTAAGLMLGGLNKLNFHLVALAIAVGWILNDRRRGGTNERWLIRSLGAVLAFGVVLPLATELAMTGADLRRWIYNVIELPFSARSSSLALIFDGRFFLAPAHEYYGALLLPYGGFFNLLIPACFVGAAWRQAGQAGLAPRVLVVAAGLLAALGGWALLATNHEIDYVAMAAGLVMVVSLWLGFRVPARGPWFIVGVWIPALLLGVAGWWSAWSGQRSQFGHANEPRSEYVDGGSLGADFGYVRGLRIPPGTAASLAAATAWRAQLPAEERSAIHYGKGLEWLERVWPVTKVPRLPLWMHEGTSYGRTESALLRASLAADGAFRYLLVPEAWDTWEVDIRRDLAENFQKIQMGPRWFSYLRLPPGAVHAQPLEFLRTFGGNADTTRLRSAMAIRELPDGRSFLGVKAGTGEMRLTLSSHRASGEAVLWRTGAGPAGARVRFEVHAVNQSERYLRWSTEVEVPADDRPVFIPCHCDASGLPLAFVVAVPPALAGQVMAGWRGPTITHAIDGPAEPPILVPGAAALAETGPDFCAALLPGTWGPARVMVRNCWFAGGRVVLPPGGEIWIKLSGLYSSLEVSFARTTGLREPADPVLRMVYYKGGRVEVLHNLAVPIDAPAKASAWSPETDGWLGLLAVPGGATEAVAVRIEAFSRP